MAGTRPASLEDLLIRLGRRVTGLEQRRYPSGFTAGMVGVFAYTSPPDGWVVANGQALSRTDYAGLFGVIGTSYGAGNGSSTFNVPNIPASGALHYMIRV